MLSCSISITHCELNPEAISERLGVMPDRSWWRGDMRTGHRVPAHQGLWTVESQHHLDSDDLGVHFAFIARFAETRREAPIAFRASGLAVRARISCAIDDDVVSAALTPGDLATVSAVVDGLDISIT
jgi:hypothetical protein